MTKTLIDLKNISYGVDGLKILEDVSLIITSGKITTIIGPNGAGKTTLLRLILGLIQPSSGQIRRTMKSVGYMPQKLSLNPLMPMTVERFLQLAQPYSNRSLKDHVNAVLHDVGGCHLKDRFMRVLSGGELQRVLLARALMLEPEILVLDEPAQGMDVLAQNELYSIIGKIRDTRGCGIVLVSHDLHMVMAASDEVVCLNQHICCSGTPQTVQENPEYLSIFGGILSPEAMAVYAHDHDHTHLHGDGCPKDCSQGKE